MLDSLWSWPAILFAVTFCYSGIFSLKADRAWRHSCFPLSVVCSELLATDFWGRSPIHFPSSPILWRNLRIEASDGASYRVLLLTTKFNVPWWVISRQQAVPVSGARTINVLDIRENKGDFSTKTTKSSYFADHIQYNTCWLHNAYSELSFASRAVKCIHPTLPGYKPIPLSASQLSRDLTEMEGGVWKGFSAWWASTWSIRWPPSCPQL